MYVIHAYSNIGIFCSFVPLFQRLEAAMFLEDILKDGFVNYKKVYELAEENGIKKTEVKRQKALLGVKSVHVDGEEGGTLWLCEYYPPWEPPVSRLRATWKFPP